LKDISELEIWKCLIIKSQIGCLKSYYLELEEFVRNVSWTYINIEYEDNKIKWVNNILIFLAFRIEIRELKIKIINSSVLRYS